MIAPLQDHVNTKCTRPSHCASRQDHDSADVEDVPLRLDRLLVTAAPHVELRCEGAGKLDGKTNADRSVSSSI